MTSRWRYGLMSTALMLVASAAAAQQHATDRGSVQVAGSASLTSGGAEGDDERFTTIGVNPRLRYFVAPGVALGADLTVAYTSRGETSSTVLAIGPAITYYFGAGGSRMHPYLSAHAMFGTVKVSSQLFDRDQSSRSWGGAGGLLTMLSSAVGLTTELFYRIDSQKFDTEWRDFDTFGLAVGVAAFVF